MKLQVKESSVVFSAPDINNMLNKAVTARVHDINKPSACEMAAGVINKGTATMIQAARKHQHLS